MSTVLDGLYYSESHEWLKVEGEFGYIGITDYAQHQLGNVVYVDLPEVDDELNQGEEFGAVESVKAASDLLSPISGIVVEINDKLEDEPELLNEDAVQNGIVEQALSEIEYKAFPADIVEKVEIDLTQYNVGDMIHVKDLPLAANSKISLVTPEDTLIVNIAEPEAVPEDEDEEAAEE